MKTLVSNTSSSTNTNQNLSILISIFRIYLCIHIHPSSMNSSFYRSMYPSYLSRSYALLSASTRSYPLLSASILPDLSLSYWVCIYIYIWIESVLIAVMLKKRNTNLSLYVGQTLFWVLSFVHKSCFLVLSFVLQHRGLDRACWYSY